MKYLAISVLPMILLLGCESGSEADMDSMSLPRDLTLKMDNAVLGAGDTLRLRLESPDSARHCIVSWDDGGAGEFLLELNTDSMWWRMAMGSVTDPRRVTLTARVSAGDLEWRDSLEVMVLEGRPGRVSSLALEGRYVTAQGRLAVVTLDNGSGYEGPGQAQVIDLSNVLFPRVISTIDSIWSDSGLKLDMPLLLHPGGFDIIDLSIAQEPRTLLHVGDTPFNGLVVDGQTLWGIHHQAPDYAGDLYRLDITNPATWIVESIVPRFLSGYDETLQLELAGRTLLRVTADYEWSGQGMSKAISLFDMTDPDHPVPGDVITQRFELLDGIGSVLLLENRLYIPGGGLRAFEVLAGSRLREVEVSALIRAQFVLPHGPDQLLCISNTSSGAVFQTVDNRNPDATSLQEERTLDLGSIQQACVLGEFILCLVDGDLQIVWVPQR